MMSPDWPSLPTINDPELLLQVYTHSSLCYDGQDFVEDVGSNDRLEDLGARVLELAITQRLFKKMPHRSAGEITERRELLCSDSNVEEWVTSYSMKKNLKYNPTLRDSINIPAVSRALFHTYLGAVYCRRGLTPISDWIDKLVDPDTPSTPPQNNSSLPPQPQNTPPHLPPPPPVIADGAQGGQNFLLLFNQRCQQSQMKVEWPQESSGPPHQMLWTVRCVVEGVERGAATASNTKKAKNAAVKEAARNLGWTI